MSQIFIYDTTLRDGTQREGISLSLDDKLKIARKLDEFGVHYIEGGWPGSNPKDVEFFRRAPSLELKNAKITAFGSTRRKNSACEGDANIQALIEAGTAVVTIVGKSWDLHVTDVLETTMDENLAMISDSVAYCKAQDKEVIYDAEHFFDGYKANPDYTLQTLLAAQEAGAEVIVCCDTNGGTLPELIVATLDAVRRDLSTPLGIHCHNDCELAIANSLAAVDHGAIQVQGTINGIGERCGNADLISVASNLALKKSGYSVLEHGSGLSHLTELSRYVYELANMNFRNGQPFVGRSAFAHKGGMHVHAVNRIAHSYEHINPELVGNERRVLVSELSGRSNIIALATKLNLQDDKQLMDKVLKQVVDLENKGYQFEAAEASFDLLVRKLAGTHTPHFELVKYHTSVVSRGGEPVCEATVKLIVNDIIRHEVAEGDGPVNALDAALRKALNGVFPSLVSMQLVDYKVRVINSDAATAASVRVVIESRDEHDTWGTVGV
ncbi:MAG: citramalate synthase, partial [Hyphomicrobiaceae bacterium]|nr:citramalate synthase [Hyphomicrobiaceae bacterium]